MAGADVYLHGIMGAAIGGAAAAGEVVGIAGFPRVMAEVVRTSRTKGNRNVGSPQPIVAATNATSGEADADAA
ncbi:MAG: hypothetical protein ACI8TX_001672 [Hyphomicrobiaceae bacterium]